MQDLRDKNRKTFRRMMCVVLVMAVLTALSAPLYNLTCRVTGWGGTTQRGTAEQAARKSIGRDITIRFQADTAPGMPWDFKAPKEGPVTLGIGADGYVAFWARNPTASTVTGTAVFNVTPLQAGKYFFKTQCFCFGEQVLAPGQAVDMPVAFYVDPKIIDDPDMKDVKTITLSYTFYRKDSKQLEKAIEKFTNDSAG